MVLSFFFSFPACHICVSALAVVDSFALMSLIRMNVSWRLITQIPSLASFAVKEVNYTFILYILPLTFQFVPYGLIIPLTASSWKCTFTLEVKPFLYGIPSTKHLNCSIKVQKYSHADYLHCTLQHALTIH